MDLFPNAIIKYLPHSILDHCSLLITTDQRLCLRLSVFRFEAWWIGREEVIPFWKNWKA